MLIFPLTLQYPRIQPPPMHNNYFNNPPPYHITMSFIGDICQKLKRKKYRVSQLKEEEKLTILGETYTELQEALKHIQKAEEITTCGFCQRDLLIAEMIVQNVTFTIVEIIEKKTDEKKKNGEYE
jgi:16S rRNA C1402 (ribose-2'-O) methylase RsmI